MTFAEVLGPYATPDEIDMAAFFLGQLRARNTYEALRWKGDDASRTAATTTARASLDRDFPKRIKKGRRP